jgi:FMN phosphatase YigB (HAD superfamily)
MDHTLLEGPFETLVFPQVLGPISLQTGLEFDMLLRMARQENLNRQANPAFSPACAMDWDEIFLTLAERLDVKLSNNAEELVRTHPGPPYSNLHPGAREALEQLAGAKPQRALILATKGLRKYQLPVLEALGILSYFDDILTPDVSQALKGSHTFFGEWPGRTGMQIMIGDNYEEDVVPAHRFGFKTVWRKRTFSGEPAVGDPFARPGEQGGIPAGHEVRPDAIILSLSELPAVVDRLEHDFQAA